MKVPNDLIGLWLGGDFLVERKDPGDDHRRENEHVRASSYSAKHPAASMFFYQDSPTRPPCAGVVNFWLMR
jgi:hypothetical protein